MTAEEFKNIVIPFSRKLYPMIFRILKNEEETRDALQGDIDLKTISELNQALNLRGLENLYKIDNRQQLPFWIFCW